MTLPFDNSYAQLPERFYEKQNPANPPDPQLLRINTGLAKELGLDRTWLEGPNGLALFSGNGVPAEATPLAQAYSGHQYGNFSPILGDGRALLLGEILTPKGKRFDLQLKGSGRTPFSRGGDGKSALGPVLREYLVSEAMHAMGIPSTRALAAVSSGENVFRQDGMVPGGIFTRIAASHIRVGTFQYFLARKDDEALMLLADHVIARHYPVARSYIGLLDAAISAQAGLIAQWMSVGFIHGVMNTDNCAISGETIDFGPCAFMDDFHPERVFSSIDRNGRYAWGNQPVMAHWNLTRFAETLLPLIDPNEEKAVARAEESLKKFAPQFQEHYLSRFRAKLALPSDSDAGFVDNTLDLLASQKLDFTLFFRQLTLVAAGGSDAKLLALASDKEPFKIWFKTWQSLAKPETHLSEMKHANPIRIPRNHRIEEAIQAAYKDDFTLFNHLAGAWIIPFEENDDLADLETPPLPEEMVEKTFCGT